MTKSKLLLLLCTLPLIGADPAGFTVWSAADLKALEKKLAGKTDDHRFSSEQLEKFGNHYTMMAHRQGDGSAELHQKDADIFVVESGSATLIVGGEMVGGKTTAPNEIRGTSVKNGVERKIAAGDIVHIAPNTPHQLLVGKGKSFTYFVVKVTQ